MGIIFTVGNYERVFLCFVAKDRQALLLESTMNLVPESDSILNLKPMLNREKHCLMLLLQSQSKATANREIVVRDRTTYN